MQNKPGQAIITRWPPARPTRAESPTAEYLEARQRLAERCRQLYIGVKTALAKQTGTEHIPRHDAYRGGRSTLGINYDPTVWTRLAQLLIEHSIDPVLFLQAQVVGGRIQAPPALVSQAGGSKALQRYQAYVINESRRIGRRLHIESTEARIAFNRRSRELPDVPPARLWRGVLHDENLSISPLWRFCAAVSEGFDDIVAEYQQEALDQYLSFAMAYDRHWSSILPERLRQEAAAIRAAAGVNAWQKE